MWIRADGVYKSIVEKNTFYEVQAILAQRNKRLTDEEMLIKLRTLWEHSGRLSSALIDESKDMPSSAYYRIRFDGIFNAYRLIGYPIINNNKYAYKKNGTPKPIK